MEDSHLQTDKNKVEIKNIKMIKTDKNHIIIFRDTSDWGDVVFWGKIQMLRRRVEIASKNIADFATSLPTSVTQLQ